MNHLAITAASVRAMLKTSRSSSSSSSSNNHNNIGRLLVEQGRGRGRRRSHHDGTTAAAAAAGGLFCLVTSALVAVQQQEQQQQQQQQQSSVGNGTMWFMSVTHCSALPQQLQEHPTMVSPIQAATSKGDVMRQTSATATATATTRTTAQLLSQVGPSSSSSCSTASSRLLLSLQDLSSLDVRNLKRDEALRVIQHIHNGGSIDMIHFMQICQATAILLKQEPTLIDKKGIDTVTVVGDLHGSLPSLKKILELIGDIHKNDQTMGSSSSSSSSSSSFSRCIVFDGDFVDRGDDSIEVLLTLLLLKIAYPEQVVLLRGNHEDSMVAQVYGFADELLRKYNLGDDAQQGQAALQTLWRPISDIFAALPMGVVTDTAFIVHGGLPSRDFRLDQLRQLTSEDRCQYHTLVQPTTPTELMLGGLLWSDPSKRPGIHPNHIRGKGVLFGRDVAHEFLTREKLTYLVRGHEEVNSGYQQMTCGDGKSVLTVFSAVDNHDNDDDIMTDHTKQEPTNVAASIINLTSDGKHTPITFHLPPPPPPAEAAATATATTGLLVVEQQEKDDDSSSSTTTDEEEDDDTHTNAAASPSALRSVNKLTRFCSRLLRLDT